MGRLRKEAKALSRKVRSGDVDAARALLAHSVQLGHERLAIRRLFLAEAMGATGLEAFREYFDARLEKLSADTVQRMEDDARRIAATYANGRNSNV